MLDPVCEGVSSLPKVKKGIWLERAACRANLPRQVADVHARTVLCCRGAERRVPRLHCVIQSSFYRQSRAS